MRARRLIGVGAAALTALAGASVFASTPPDSAPPGSDVTYPTVPPYTVVPTTTTTILDPSSTTEAPTTTVVSPAAQVPPVTLAPLNPAEQAVVDALYEARTLYLEVLMNPDAPGLDARLDAAYARSGDPRGQLEETRQEFRDLGVRAYMNDADPWRLIIESVAFYEEPYPRANVVACYVDTTIMYEPGGAPDGSDQILNDAIAATRAQFTMVPEDGRWQLWIAGQLGEMRIGESECAAG